jgi:hypothetical protein
MSRSRKCCKFSTHNEGAVRLSAMGLNKQRVACPWKEIRLVEGCEACSSDRNCCWNRVHEGGGGEDYKGSVPFAIHSSFHAEGNSCNTLVMS